MSTESAVIQAPPLPSWVDSHCHFDFAQFDQDRETHWQYLQSMGCAGLIIPGVTAATWPKLIQICANKPWSYALGLHPYFLDQHQPDHIEQLQQMCHTHTPVAIGEFGLDFALPPSTFLAQRNLCEQQFKLAKQHQLPVILHARKAYDEIAAMIRRTHFQQGGIVHAFSGSVQQGHALIKLGFKLGIGGAISHKRAIKLRTTVMQLPLESHNPTQGNRQGNDIGTQYRSGIYTYSEQQQTIAEQTKQHFQQVMQQAGFDAAITTEILPAPTFYFAEDYHQQYLAKEPNGYCGLGGLGLAY